MNIIEQMETRPLVRVRVRRRRPKKRRSKKPLMLVLALLFVCASVLSVVGYRLFDIHYNSDLSLAQTGIQHLQKAEALLAASPQNALDTHIVSRAEQEFSSAAKGGLPS